MVLSTTVFDEYACVDGTSCFFLTSSKVIDDADSFIKANILHKDKLLEEYDDIIKQTQKHQHYGILSLL